MKKMLHRVLVLSLICVISSTVYAGDLVKFYMQQDVLKYVNKYRATKGLKALKFNEYANIEAEKHSRAMAAHKVPFGHHGFSNRFSRLRHEVKDVRGGAENVAFNYKTPKIVVENWIKSPGHRKNILGDYNLTGIGLARDKQGRLYYTQMFLKTKY